MYPILFIALALAELLAISLIFGILVSTILTLVIIPLLYYVAYSKNPPLPTKLKGDLV